VSLLHGCRSCGEAGLEPVLSLGRTPLANALLTREQLEEPEPTYPLDLVLCPACGLVQITETVPPEELFADYPYFSSFSDTMVAHARELAERLVAERGLGPASRVVEVASNDGYLLQWYRAAGVGVLGIEPAANVARVAREERGIETREVFFGRDAARTLVDEGVRADVVHAHNVLAHVPDLNGVVAGMALLLAPGGLAVVEVPYVRDMIEKVEFDTIYHEHLCYFSLTALDALARRGGLRVLDVERVPIHGGSLRLMLGRAEDDAPAAPAVAALRAEERELGLHTAAPYRAFAARVEAVRRELPALLHELADAGGRLAAYGASAKGSTLLNACGIGSDLLAFAADRSTVKQGRYTPGTHLEIVPPERLLESMPDYVLLLTWNFRDEILAQQAEYRRRGGRFVVPIPRPEVV
jgi:SAM-dependent methyltransferase